MYAVYTYRAGSTATNILADVVKMLTGETLVSNLSVDCVQASSSIDASVYSAGWSVWDSVSANQVVLRAPWDASNGSGYNYVYLDTSTAGFLQTHIYETWNNVSHTGTNGYVLGTTYHQRINTSLGGQLFLFANSGHAMVLLSYQSSVWGNSSNSGASTILERTRMGMWDTNTNAYPVLLLCTGNVSFSSRIPIQNGTDSSRQLTTYYTADMYTTIDSYFRPTYRLRPVITADGYTGSTQIVNFFAESSSLTDVWCTNIQTKNLDEFRVGSVSYVRFGSGNSTAVVRKG